MADGRGNRRAGERGRRNGLVGGGGHEINALEAIQAVTSRKKSGRRAGGRRDAVNNGGRIQSERCTPDGRRCTIERQK